MKSRAKTHRVEVEGRKSDVRELRTAGGMQTTAADGAWGASAGVIAFISGDIVKGHRLGPLLVRSRTGVIFRAFHARLGVVALKLFTVDDPERTRGVMLRAAAWAEAGISHPNLTSVIDVGEYLMTPYAVTELASGTPLARYVGVSIPMVQALRWLLDVARGLEAAHAAGLVHGDVRASKIVVAPTGAKLLIFGAPPAASMAPEQRGEAPLTDARSDQYGWALVACELILGFRAQGDASAKPSLSDLPEAIRPILERALQTRASARFSRMHDIVSALTPIVAAAGMEVRAMRESVAPASASASCTVTKSSRPPAAIAKTIPVPAAPAPSAASNRALESVLVRRLAESALADVKRDVGPSLREAAVVVAVDVVGTKGRYSVQLAATDDAGRLHLPSVSTATLEAAGTLVGSSASPLSSCFRRLSFRMGPSGLDASAPIARS